MDRPVVASQTTVTTELQEAGKYFKTDHIKADIKGRAVRGSAVIMASEIIKLGLTVVSTVLLARLLSPSDFGLIAMVAAVTGIVELFNDLGLSAATIQREQVNQQQISLLFWINVGLGFALSLVTALLAPVIAWIYSEPQLVTIAIVLSCNFIFGGLTVQHRALLKRQMRFSALVYIDVIVSVINTAVGIAAAVSGYGLWSLVLMKIAAAPVDVIAVWLACPWRPGKLQRASDIRSMLAFGGNLTGYKILQYLARNVDNLLIGSVYGSLQLGLYTKAYNLLLLPLQVVNRPLTTVAIPMLSRLVDSPERYREEYGNMVAKICLLTMPLVAFMVGTSDWLVLAALGPQWTSVSTIFAWLGLAGLVEPFTYTTIWLFTTQGRTRQQLRWGVISSIMVVSAIVAGLPWGTVGVAISYALVSLCVRTPLLLWFVGRTGPVRTRTLYAALAPFAGAVCATLLAIWLYRQVAPADSLFINLACAAMITGCVSITILGLFPVGRLALRDLKTIPALIFRRNMPA